MRTKGRPCFRHTAPWGPFTMYTKLMLPSPTSWTCALRMAAQQSVPQQLAGRSNPVFPFLGTHLNQLSGHSRWVVGLLCLYLLFSPQNFRIHVWLQLARLIFAVTPLHTTKRQSVLCCACMHLPGHPSSPPPAPPTNHYVLSAGALATDWFCRTHASSMHVFYVQNLAAYNERPSRVPCRPAIGTKGTTGRR